MAFVVHIVLMVTLVALMNTSSGSYDATPVIHRRALAVEHTAPRSGHVKRWKLRSRLGKKGSETRTWDREKGRRKKEQNHLRSKKSKRSTIRHHRSMKRRGVKMRTGAKKRQSSWHKKNGMRRHQDSDRSNWNRRDKNSFKKKRRFRRGAK